MKRIEIDGYTIGKGLIIVFLFLGFVGFVAYIRQPNKICMYDVHYGKDIMGQNNYRIPESWDCTSSYSSDGSYYKFVGSRSER